MPILAKIIAVMRWFLTCIHIMSWKHFFGFYDCRCDIQVKLTSSLTSKNGALLHTIKEKK